MSKNQNLRCNGFRAFSCYYKLSFVLSLNLSSLSSVITTLSSPSQPMLSHSSCHLLPHIQKLDIVLLLPCSLHSLHFFCTLLLYTLPLTAGCGCWLYHCGPVYLAVL
ncbi:hypothetical protein C8R42DRAFT_281626 [Lentinula raphanica]|nr:hypothetical protein C8R42DRAFT_281626 [Lentinula raphanica]